MICDAYYADLVSIGSKPYIYIGPSENQFNIFRVFVFSQSMTNL